MAFVTDGLHEPDLLLCRQLDEALSGGLFNVLHRWRSQAESLLKAASREHRCPESGNINVGWTKRQRVQAADLLRKIGIGAVVRHKLDNDRSPERQALRGIRSGESRREATAPRDAWILGMHNKGHSVARIIERLPHRFGKALSRQQVYRIIKRDSEGVDTSRRRIAPKDWVRLPISVCRELMSKAARLRKAVCNTSRIESERGNRIPAGEALPQDAEGRRKRVFKSTFARLMMRRNHHCEPEAAKWAVNDANQLEQRPLREGDLRRIANAAFRLAQSKWPVRATAPKPAIVVDDSVRDNLDALADMLGLRLD